MFRLPRPAPARRPATRLRLEGLDDRSLPSAVGFSTALPAVAGATAVDAAGNTVVSSSAGGVYKFGPTGNLLASNTTVAAGGGVAVDPAGDVFLNSLGKVTELDPTLRQTLFTVTLPGATYSAYGGGGNVGTGGNGAVAVAGGKIYAVGAAGAGLPTTVGAYQPTFPGAATGLLSAYLAVIDPVAGPTPAYYLTYCTYLGGTALVPSMPASSYGYVHGASASGVAVDPVGAVYLTGTTDAADFPTTAGAFQTVNRAAAVGGYGGGWTTYVAKVVPTQIGAASLAYSTFLGGSGRDGYVTDIPAYIQTPSSGPAVAVDGAGAAYVTGTTTSADFPVTAGAFQTTYAPASSHGYSYGQYQPGHAYVTKLNPAGTGLAYSTLLGGSDADWGEGVAVDAAGDAWVAGSTRSDDFPVTPGAVQPHRTTVAVAGFAPMANAFVVELDPTGGAEKYGTYWGGSEDTLALGVGLDGSGNVSVAGQLHQVSLNPPGTYPTTKGAYLKSGNGFLLKFRP